MSDQNNLEQFNFYHKLNTELMFDAPRDFSTLEHRLQNLLGRSIAELATLAKIKLPPQNIQGKGIAGQLVELFLGANAHNLSLPDFVDLQIELKTVPVDSNLMPIESTFLCIANISPNQNFIPFKESALYHKVRNLLFVLIFAPKGMHLGQRRIAGYFFVQPTESDLRVMEADYNEFYEYILQGRAQEINAGLGNLIQMRPKAANSSSTLLIRDQNGELAVTRPRGYYLRSSYTKNLCQRLIQEQDLKPNYFETLQRVKDSLVSPL